MNQAFVAILMGSKNDLSCLQITIDTLAALNIPYEVNVLSAHRTPTLTKEYIESAESRGAQIFIAAAGLAAHLAGAVAAHTIKPVIGIPLDAGTLGGLDSLLSTVQMPGGMPVATTTIGKPGAKNAAILAAEILALQNPDLAASLLKMRQDKREAIKRDNEQLV